MKAGVMLFVIFAVCVLMGDPISMSLGIGSLAAVALGNLGVSPAVIAQRVFGGLQSTSIMAIAFFILAGNLMAGGGISRRIVNFANCLIGNIRGGMSVALVIACAFFAALSGSAPATVVAIGSMLYADMVKQGYPEDRTAGLLVIAGGLGPVIPPSIIMVLYCTLTGASVTNMFSQGMVIGILIMIVLITAAKYIAALLTQKTFKLSSDQRTVIFGLSSAHVATTLAAVMVGYNVIIGQTPDGEPIRLLGESVLNGTILMILATCTISTFATQRGAHNIAIKGVRENDESTEHQDEHILIPVSNEESVRELVTLGNVLKSKKNHNGFYALHAIDNKVEDSGLEKRARKILETAATAAAASDIYLHELLRYDVNISNAIASVAKEQSITDIVMGLHRDKSPAIFLGKITGDLLGESNVTTYIYKPVQPLATIKRHIVIIPSQAEKEAGFLMWLHKIGNLARNTGTKIVVYAPETTLKYIEPLRRKQTATVETVLFKDWEKLPALLRELRTDDCLWLVMSRRERISYQPAMNKIPAYLDQYLGRNSFVLIYPVQAGDPESRYL